jgi:hypothetical protein
VSDAGNGTGGGVSLVDNDGATISFEGGLHLSTGTRPAFAASDGGTVTVLDPPSGRNTIVTTSGQALGVTDTLVGAAGLTFESISANGVEEIAIYLSNTGAGGGLTVTGDPAVGAGSGGTIRNSRVGYGQEGGRAPRLSFMNFTNDITGWADYGVGLINVSGIGQLTSTSVSSADRGVSIQNVGDLTFTISGSGCTFGLTPVAVSVGTAGTDTTAVTVRECAFSNVGVAVVAGAGEQATQDIVVAGNSITILPDQDDWSAVLVKTLGSGHVNARVESNTITTDLRGISAEIDEDALADAALNIAVLNNTLTIGSSPDSGAIAMDIPLAGTICARVAGNVSTNTAAPGINFDKASGSSFAVEGIALGVQPDTVVESGLASQNPMIGSVDVTAGNAINGVANGACTNIPN